MSTNDEAKINPYVRKAILAAKFFQQVRDETRVKMKVERLRLPARLELAEA